MSTTRSTDRAWEDLSHAGYHGVAANAEVLRRYARHGARGPLPRALEGLPAEARQELAAHPRRIARIAAKVQREARRAAEHQEETWPLEIRRGIAAERYLASGMQGRLPKILRGLPGDQLRGILAEAEETSKMVVYEEPVETPRDVSAKVQRATEAVAVRRAADREPTTTDQTRAATARRGLGAPGQQLTDRSSQ